MWRSVQWKGTIDAFTAFLILFGDCICDSMVGISESVIYLFQCGIVFKSENSLLTSINT